VSHEEEPCVCGTDFICLALVHAAGLVLPTALWNACVAPPVQPLRNPSGTVHHQPQPTPTGETRTAS